MNKIIAIFTVLFAMCNLTFSQVTVAPVTIHLSDINKNGYILIRNNSSTTSQEIGIEIKFGYPKSDSTGKTIIYFPDTVNESDPSIVNCVNFYPRKFILKPLEEQTVRIAVKPKNLVEGEYWGRPVIISRVANSEDSGNTEKINAGLGVEFRTVIALNYRKGKVNTKINFDELTGTYSDNKFILFAKLKREGNAAYIGNLLVEIYDEKGISIKKFIQDISVYYELNKRIEMETGKLPKGNYTVEVKLNTDREETGGKIIKGNSVSKKIIVSIN